MNTRLFSSPVILHRPTIAIFSALGVHILTLDGFLRGGSTQEYFFRHATHAQCSSASLRELIKLQYAPAYSVVTHVSGSENNHYLIHRGLQRLIRLTVDDT